MAYQYIRTAKDGGVAHIELNRPESLNAWIPDMARELLDALQAASADPSARALLLTGAGRAFSAGADVKLARDVLPNGDLDLSSWLRVVYNPVVLAVREMPKPVVGAIQGAAAGLGASLALSCDLLIAGESSYLLFAFVNIAVMPDAGALRFLAERAGLARAAELAMLGERLPAAKALEWGLVNRVVPDEAVAVEGMALAQRLAVGPTLALANIKKTLNETAQVHLADQLAIEADRQQDHGGSFDYREGRAAFVEKRKAQFEGR
ncbi:MAG TPA: enoyl-CoA hydratase-related protein [Sporichthya sp.]|nr:enoyl-CoA hydratase-related protein [Sporichthya sp.]